MNLADVHVLYRTDHFQVLDFKCHCDFCSVSDPEYNKSFTMSFIRKGFFGYRSFRREDEMHVGRVLLSKPGFEHVATHIDNQPDFVTIFDFKKSFFEELAENYAPFAPWFFLNNDIHSLVLNANPELEYSHHRIYRQLISNKFSTLQVDEMILGLLEKVIFVLAKNQQAGKIPDKLKQYHLVTVEKARAFLFNHFRESISLHRLAAHCLVSPFHFSRIFKDVTGFSPHQYLSSVRLNHAKILLVETTQSVTDIAYECGFNSVEHFVTAFRQYFQASPSAVRKQLAGV